MEQGHRCELIVNIDDVVGDGDLKAEVVVVIVLNVVVICVNGVVICVNVVVICVNELIIHCPCTPLFISSTGFCYEMAEY